MTADQTDSGYKIWAVDGVVYGPVELPTLVQWIKEERVSAETWIFIEQTESWKKAGKIQELQMFFRPKSAGDVSFAVAGSTGQAASSLKPGVMRRVKILAELNDQQLERFVQFMEILSVRQWHEIVKTGDPGDSMYLVLEGELRVRMMIAGKESILATLMAGEFFGDISLFDQGTRSADVVANKDSVLLKISATNFDRLLSKAPELAAPFLFCISKTLVARIRADNKRYKDSINFARTAGN